MRYHPHSCVLSSQGDLRTGQQLLDEFELDDVQLGGFGRFFATPRGKDYARCLLNAIHAVSDSIPQPRVEHTAS